MVITVGHIVDALASLGGEAHLRDIERKVRETAPPPLPENPQASIRARIQERCEEAKSYLGGENLFESVYGVQAKKGFWRLRHDQLDAANADSVQDGADAFLDAEEGRASLRIHLRRERSKKLIEAFKSTLIEPRCEACGMSFREVYGDLGREYIEAHHKIPVARLDEHSRTSLGDLAAVCSNCHRIIHMNGLISVEELALHLAGMREGQG
jgi:putative restriction endonuclease